MWCVFTGIEPNNQQGQLDWLNPPDSDERINLMRTIDQLNKRYGKGSIKTAQQNLSNEWQMRRDRLSPRVTSNLNELLFVK